MQEVRGGEGAAEAGHGPSHRGGGRTMRWLQTQTATGEMLPTFRAAMIMK